MKALDMASTAVTIIAVSVIGAGYAVAQTYTLVDLGSLGGGSTSARAINSASQVVGCSNTGAGVQHAFLYSAGVMTDLGTLGGPSCASGINTTGQVVGWSDIGNGQLHAFLWSGGVMTDLGTLGGGDSEAEAINAAGQVVGSSSTASNDQHAFLYSAGMMTDLGTLSGVSAAGSDARSINTGSEIAGYSGTGSSGSPSHGFRYSGGAMNDLGTLGGNYSDAMDVNDAGQIVGWASAADTSMQAFLYSPGTGMTDLGTFVGGTFSLASAINSAGQVVGWADISGGSVHAVIWSAGVMTDLNTLIAPGSGWLLSQAFAINDMGQIVGVGDRGGFFLTPPTAATPTATITSTQVSTETPTQPPAPDTPTPTEAATSTGTESKGNTPTVTPAPAFSCPATPAAGCRASARSLISLKDNALDRTDSLVWKWLKGAQTYRLDFGDPLHTTNYALCIYDKSGGTLSLAMNAVAPAGGTCVTRPCWKETSAGFRYRDRNEIADGLLSIVLKSGADGRASIAVKGRGPLLPLPTPVSSEKWLNQDPAVIVQLLKSDGGPCWSAEYPAPARLHTTTRFKAKF